MRSLLHLKSFYIYNLILILGFCIIVNPINNFNILNSSFYCIFHFLLIYLGVYHYKIILFFIYFLYGLGLDLLWFNEIGPHLLIFMIILVTLNLSSKYLYNLNSFKIYLFLLFLQILTIFFESILSYILFNFRIDLSFFYQISFLSLFLSYPIFVLFSKIDNI